MILWPDTFTNHFHPEIGKAAVEVLESAGYEVLVPPHSLCCGRPLYDFGMLDKAQALLTRMLGTLRPEIRRGIPLVGLEPSCLSVFRDELVNLFPHDEDAQRLNKQCFTLSEFLANEVDGYEPPKLNRKAIVHGHCHHRSVMEMDAEMKLLKEMGLEIETPEPGCCGMAGSFGFESGEHYRRVDGLRRTRSASCRATRERRDAHHRRRIQLSGADRPIHSAKPAAFRTGSANGPARRDPAGPRASRKDNTRHSPS